MARGACSLSLLLRQQKTRSLFPPDQDMFRHNDRELQTLCSCYVKGNLPKDSITVKLFSAKRRVKRTTKPDATMTMALPHHRPPWCMQTAFVCYSAAAGAAGSRIAKALAIVMGTKEGI